MFAAPGAQTTKVSSRGLKRRLVSTAGQYGAVKRLQLRAGAWELIPSLGQAVTGPSHAFVPILEGAPGRERSRVSFAEMTFLVPSPGCPGILGWETYDR